MTTQGQIVYSEEVIYEMEIDDARTDPQCSFDSIPNELIEYHIFGYFWFHYWTQHFVSVCKRWKKICENSKITPKQLRISVYPSGYVDFERATLWVKKYQPTTLELSIDGLHSYSASRIQELIGASDAIDTLLLNNAQDFQLFEPSSAQARIRTLSLRGGFSNAIFKLFPALQRLQLYTTCWDISLNEKFPVEELTIIDPASVEFSLEHVDVPKLTLVKGNKVYKKIDGIVTELRMPMMTYEEYFRYFGKTKMFVMLSGLNPNAAAKFLKNSTSYEYEADLVENNFISYKYPTNINIANYDSVFAHYYYKEHPSLLSNKLPVSDDIKFILLAKAGNVDGAVSTLAKIGEKIMVEYESTIDIVKIKFAFFRLLSYPQVDKRIFNDRKLREAAKAITKCEIGDGCKLLQTAQQFDKISDLIDWSDAFAKVDDYDLFWAMIKKGAKLPYRTFSDRALNIQAGSPFSKILYEWTKQDPWSWSHIANMTPETPSSIMRRIGILPAVVTSGIPKWLTWNKHSYQQLAREEVLNVYINHMDSAGSTILLKMIEDLDERSIERLLMAWKGVDPNVHRRGKLSPLATLLVRSAPKQQVNSKMIQLLFKSGADVNLACTFEGRQCSPLMIAVLVGSPLPTISLLIALGARTDYCDDQGRSVVECVVECESKYEASDYRTLKWCIKG